ncbi:MAG: sodium:solute symporter [Prochlorococcaceae cyanobacterium MAG_34]|nr:sodium:solute symporter [Cyanobium sp. MAG_216]MDP4830112.1 sodium:solute symporter [Cyanobium sp. MAG_185]MDP4882088.1 sodium:solute symporter [Cyanobium sp. MAG_137]MDP4947339.1 sodium:solute symporter [Cyanobium sp. MAG_102]MDP5118114.1 sodium:solute symporter [Prochlorococcaceae cyanobacterium MAG_34]
MASDLLPSFGWLALALTCLSLILAVGRALGARLQLRLWGIPEALLAGLLGLLLAPGGPLPLLPPEVMQLWADLPLVLLTLVFGSLLLGKPLPKLEGLWRPVSGQVSLALVLAFGQYVVGGLAVLLVLQPWLGVSPVMACLIEVAYEGGHGSAAAMGPSYAALGFPGGQALGLAMATVGLLSSTLVGGLVVVLARSRGWLLADAPGSAASESASAASGDSGGAMAWAAAWAVNLALVGLAVLTGVGLLGGLRWLTAGLGDGVASVIDALPVFPLAIVGSLLVRLALERSDKAHWASSAVQGQVGTLSADLLITAATAGLDLALLKADWLPLTVLALGGLVWNLAVTLLLAPRLLPADWFERAVIEFGQATGVAASGLLLLRMADPDDRSDALPAFSIKQLMLQPFLAGGVVTVVAPLAVAGWGLPLWTGFCFALVLLFGGTGLWLARNQAPAP